MGTGIGNKDLNRFHCDIFDIIMHCNCTVLSIKLSILKTVVNAAKHDTFCMKY